MTGPLDELFAQVREAVNHSATEAHHQDAYGTRPDWYHAAHDALAAIERHVQDMESAIEEWAFDQGYDSLSAESIVVDIRNRAAALPAREKGATDDVA